MGVLDSLLSKMKLNEEDEDFYDDDIVDDDPDDVDDDFKPKSRKKFYDKFTGKSEDFLKEPEEKAPSKSRAAAKKPAKITQMRPARKASGGTVINLIKPIVVDEAQQKLADCLKNYEIVILNLQGLSERDAQRISDFAMGANYALNGTYKRIADYIYAIAPAGIEFTEEITSQMEEKLTSSNYGYSYYNG